MLLPEKLQEFAIEVIFQPNSAKGGYLFSVVNPLDTIVQLGLHFSPVMKDVWNVSLIYTSPEDSHASKKLVTYQLPYKPKKWSSLSFQVLTDKVIFYNDCQHNETRSINREPQELIFDSASTLYLAQAGPLLAGHFEVSDYVHTNVVVPMPKKKKNHPDCLCPSSIVETMNDTVRII